MDDSRRSGLDLARLTLRGVVGSTMVAHGVRHARSLPGTARWFGGIGFAQPKLQAAASAVVEVGSGVALLAGAATPVAAAAVVGTMAVAGRTVHQPNGYFIVDEGYEYVLSLAATSAALAALGSGRWSVDAVLNTPGSRGGARFGLAALLVGIAGAAIQLGAFWRRPAPAADPDGSALRDKASIID